MEDVEAGKTAQIAAVIVDARLMAHLLALGILGKFQEEQARSVGVEHFQAVELAIAGNGI